MPFNIVLVEPEIPQNTGNIVRTCAATGSVLHLVRPLGFEISDKHLKRAGLDYWYLTDIRYYDSFEQLQENFKDKKFYFASTKSQISYSDVKYDSDCFIVFGKETKGLNESLLKQNYDSCIRIPMVSDSRSLNLANSVAVILYEALRHNDFSQLTKIGKLNI